MKHSPLAGILIMVGATFIFALQDTITKTLTTDLPVTQIVFIRFLVFALMALFFAHRKTGVRLAIRSSVPFAQVLRCVVMCAEITLFAYALRFLGVAEIHALFACFPLFVAALSVPLLGEQVGWRRWLAVGLGFVGTLIMLQPGSTVFNPYALLPLICAVLYAVYNLLTRKVSKSDSYTTSLLYFGLVGAFLSGVLAIWQWQQIPTDAILRLAALCVTSLIGHMMLMKALELTQAVVLQPFQYLILPWAMVLGYLTFNESLSVTTIAGAVIVVGSGVYVAYREYRQINKR